MAIMYKITKDIDPKQYFNITRSVGWGEYRSVKGYKIAIKNSLFIAAAFDKNQLVGIIRLIGDGIYIFHIADMTIHKNYQSKKIGTKLLQMAKEYINEVAKKCGEEMAEFTLFANIGAVEFYKKAGFISAPNGMVYIDTEKRRKGELDFQKKWLKAHSKN